MWDPGMAWMNGSTVSQYRAGVSVTYSVVVCMLWSCISPDDIPSEESVHHASELDNSNTSKRIVAHHFLHGFVVFLMLACFELVPAHHEKLLRSVFPDVLLAGWIYCVHGDGALIRAQGACVLQTMTLLEHCHKSLPERAWKYKSVPLHRCRFEIVFQTWGCCPAWLEHLTRQMASSTAAAQPFQALQTICASRVHLLHMLKGTTGATQGKRTCRAQPLFLCGRCH